MLASKVDLNQPQIIRDLRKLGACVTVISSVGKGVPDLLVSYQDRWWLFELKNPDNPKSKQRLTKDEQRWVNKQKAPVYIIRDTLEAIVIFNNAKREER